MTLTSIKDKYAYAYAKCKNIRIRFFETCQLNFKNVKFDSSSNEEVTC
jgi:hypothetical protein